VWLKRNQCDLNDLSAFAEGATAGCCFCAPYIVLGNKEQARAAADDARRALASDPDKLRRVDDLIKELARKSET